MKRVLFVDDEFHNLDGLRRIMRPMRDEWDMAFASSGELALELMAASPFDVIVSDMRMPGMDGAQLLTHVRELYPQVVRIVLSGHTEIATALRVVPVAHQFLAKPCDAEMLRVAIERASHLLALLNDESLRSYVGALGDLPALPRTYAELTQALEDPESSLPRIAGIVEQDQGISAKILQLVNSAFFGSPHIVTDIQTAVSYLGINTLKCLVLSVEIFRIFDSEPTLPGFSPEDLQQHAQLTAHIIGRLPVPKHIADLALASAMLHDIGKLIEAWALPGRFAEFLGEAVSTGRPLYEVEQAAFGFSHAEIGAYLLGIWGLPYAVVETVALHHAPNRVPHPSFDAPAAVYVANILAHQLESLRGDRAQEFDLEKYREDLVRLGVWEKMTEWQALVQDLAEPMLDAAAN